MHSVNEMNITAIELKFFKLVLPVGSQLDGDGVRLLGDGFSHFGEISIIVDVLAKRGHIYPFSSHIIIYFFISFKIDRPIVCPIRLLTLG